MHITLILNPRFRLLSFGKTREELYRRFLPSEHRGTDEVDDPIFDLGLVLGSGNHEAVGDNAPPGGGRSDRS